MTVAWSRTRSTSMMFATAWMATPVSDGPSRHREQPRLDRNAAITESSPLPSTPIAAIRTWSPTCRPSRQRLAGIRGLTSLGQTDHGDRPTRAAGSSASTNPRIRRRFRVLPPNLDGMASGPAHGRGARPRPSACCQRGIRLLDIISHGVVLPFGFSSRRAAPTSTFPSRTSPFAGWLDPAAARACGAQRTACFLRALRRLCRRAPHGAALVHRRRGCRSGHRHSPDRVIRQLDAISRRALPVPPGYGLRYRKTDRH